MFLLLYYTWRLFFGEGGGGERNGVRKECGAGRGELFCFVSHPLYLMNEISTSDAHGWILTLWKGLLRRSNFIVICTEFVVEWTLAIRCTFLLKVLLTAKRKLERYGAGTHQKNSWVGSSWPCSSQGGADSGTIPDMVATRLQYLFYSGKQSAPFLTWELRVLAGHWAGSPRVFLSHLTQLSVRIKQTPFLKQSLQHPWWCRL